MYQDIYKCICQPPPPKKKNKIYSIDVLFLITPLAAKEGGLNNNFALYSITQLGCKYQRQAIQQTNHTLFYCLSSSDERPSALRCNTGILIKLHSVVSIPNEWNISSILSTFETK